MKAVKLAIKNGDWYANLRADNYIYSSGESALYFGELCSNTKLFDSEKEIESFLKKYGRKKDDKIVVVKYSIEEVNEYDEAEVKREALSKLNDVEKKIGRAHV